MSITRAPWKVGRTLSNGQECIVGDGDTVVALMPDATMGCTFKPDDARLIIAAPLMMEALLEILPFIPITSANEGGASAYSENVRAADKVRVAIAAATGEKA